jgi:hypothetical protein
VENRMKSLCKLGPRSRGRVGEGFCVCVCVCVCVCMCIMGAVHVLSDPRSRGAVGERFCVYVYMCIKGVVPVPEDSADQNYGTWM